ncbi:MAG TPA: hypothetical protein VGK06_15275 [Methanosarcina sp.]|jgi:thiamine biosynthesis lipoprotein ApbE
MIFITERNTQAINNYLHTAGLKIGYSTILQFAQECEQNFTDHQVPDTYRIGTACSKVWKDSDGAYDFTIKRLTCGYWALIQAGTSLFETHEASLPSVIQCTQ